MSRFYGILPSHSTARKTDATARGHATTGMQAEACAWGGKIVTRLYVDDEGRDCFVVTMESHHGSGDTQSIASGIVGDRQSVNVNPAL